jgi:hypothetical protein
MQYKIQAQAGLAMFVSRVAEDSALLLRQAAH